MTKYLRKLITKDGIESPLEEIKDPPYPRRNVIHRETKEAHPYDGHKELGVATSKPIPCREYRITQEQHMIVFVYEEV